MGAKFTALATATATVNKYGTPCKKDVDCTNGTAKYGIAGVSTAIAITGTGNIAKSCCMYYEPTKKASGTTAQIAVSTASNTSLNQSYGLTSTVGEYNLYCNTDFPSLITSFKTTTSYASYDSKTGLVVGLAANGASEAKFYCDGGAQAVAFATLAVAAASISMY